MPKRSKGDNRRKRKASSSSGRQSQNKETEKLTHTPVDMAGEGMARLNTASSFHGEGDPQLIQVNYRTGAKFEGKVVDHKRIGRGTFVWPNGSKYEGDFADNLRHGKGTQVWSDGSSYTGEFVNDLRHGSGSICWSNGEAYEGTFFKDRRHGKGTYKWPDGSSYTGTFYMDKKEGYGTFSFASGDVFQGLYKEDEREGPGLVTYKNGLQDVGLWRGEKLIKLCSKISGAFTITCHPEFDYKPEEHILYIDLVDKNDSLAPIEDVLNPPSALDYPPKSDLSEKVNELYSEALDPRSLAVDRQTFDKEFFRDMQRNSEMPEQVAAWNATPGMVALQKHTMKHAVGKHGVKVDIDAIMKLDRSKFKDKGPLEHQSEELITAAGAGDKGKVEVLLNSGIVHPDVSDCHGHTALIGATVNWHIDIINVLLNEGANVNKLSDEGCSALAAGTIFYYPIEGFLYNIAERYMQPPPELVSDSKNDILLRGILANNKERRASRLNQINRIRSASIVSGDTKTDPVTGKTSDKPDITTTRPSGPLDMNKKTLEKLIEDNDNNNNCGKEDSDSAYGDDYDGPPGENDEDDDEESPEDFESNQSMRNYHIEVTEQLVERCATQLSHNQLVVSREVSDVTEVGKARRLAIQMSHHERMKDTLDLLLRRGADPNASSVPMPVLFFAIKSADVEMVKQLLMKGANTNTKLNKEKGGLYPIHIACAIPGEEGVQITELLLDALADPDARAAEDNSFLNHFLEEEWSKDTISEDSKALLGGRTALQIACARDDSYKNACRVVRLLLEHKANTSLMCNGFSPLALAIASGNDLAIDELLLFGTDPSLPLTHGIGSALCAATSNEYEHRRTIQGRLQLVDKLVKAGANVLAPIPIGAKRVQGTAVDYAYYMFNQDRRIAHMPYHALTHAERETYNARRKLLAHIGDIMRNKAVEREKKRTHDEERVGLRSQSPSANFVYIGAGAKLPPGYKSKSAGKGGQGQVKFESSEKDEVDVALTLDTTRAQSPTRSGVVFVDSVSPKQLKRLTRDRAKTPVRKPLFKYCYECGRSVGVRLAACTRCKEVYYCSKACKLKAWNARHREECIRVGGRSRSPSPKARTESPTAATLANRGKNATGSQRILDSGMEQIDPARPDSRGILADLDRMDSSLLSFSELQLTRCQEDSDGGIEMDNKKRKSRRGQKHSGHTQGARRQAVHEPDGKGKNRGNTRPIGYKGEKQHHRHSVKKSGRRTLPVEHKEDMRQSHRKTHGPGYLSPNGIAEKYMTNHYVGMSGARGQGSQSKPMGTRSLNAQYPMKVASSGRYLSQSQNPKRDGLYPSRLPPIDLSQLSKHKGVPTKGLSKSAEGERKMAKHRFRTGSPPNYYYVYIDNYSHN